MNFSDNTAAKVDVATNDVHPANAGVVLVREAGVPFQPSLDSNSGVDPIAEWLSLMEVVQMLCPTWPVRDKPMQGNDWRL